MELFTFFGVGKHQDQEFTLTPGWLFKGNRMVIDYPDHGLRCFDVELFIRNNLIDNHTLIQISHGLFKPYMGLFLDKDEDKNSEMITICIVVNGLVSIDYTSSTANVLFFRHINKYSSSMIIVNLHKKDSELNFAVIDMIDGKTKDISILYDPKECKPFFVDYSKQNLRKIFPERNNHVNIVFRVFNRVSKLLKKSNKMKPLAHSRK